MASCKNHEICFSCEIYESENIAHILCKLSSCLGSGFVDSTKSLISGLQDVKNATTPKEKKDACVLLLCLLAGLEEIPEVEYVVRDIFDLCKEGCLEKKLLYLALTSRSEPQTLLAFLDHDRKFLQNEKSLCEGLIESDRDIVMELFVLSVKKECHWLLLLLVEVTSLLCKSYFEPVKKLFAHPFLEHLWPILLLYMLQQQCDLASLRVPVDECLVMDGCEPHIKNIAKKIQWYSKVVLWIKENGISCYPSSDWCTKYLSTLSLINQCCKISDLQWDKTHEFLSQNSFHGKLVNKWEVVLYDAFSACSIAYDYILTCLNSKLSKIPHCGPTLNENFPKMKTIISEIQPLSVRLKVLESIFSLLFLQYEDFHEDVHSDSEEDERETIQSPQHDDCHITNKSMETMSSSLTSITNMPETQSKVKSKSYNTSALNCCGQSLNVANTWHQSCHQKHGFVCDRYMTKDLLQLLDSCLVCVHDFECSSWSDTPEEYLFALTESTQVQQDWKSLQKKVTDALWKLEILFELESIQQEDFLLERIYPRDWMFHCCLNEDSASDDELHGIKGTNVSPRYPDLEKSSESGSQSNMTSCGLNAKWNHKVRRKSTTRYSIRGTKDTTIKKMLSSKHSLVAQILKRGNLKAAKKVIQVYKMEGSEICREVDFLEAYRSLHCKINDCAVEFNRQCQSSPLHQSQNSTLKAIQRAASVGVKASSLNKEVEKLLLSPSLPRISDVERISKDYLQLFGGSSHEQPIVTAAVDIALMLSTSTRQASNILNIASQHSLELKNLQVTLPARAQAMGFLPLLQGMLQVTVSDSVSPSELLHRWDVPNFVSRSCRDNVQFWDSLKMLLGELRITSDYFSLFPKFLQLTSSLSFIKGLDCKQDIMYLQDFKSYLKLLKACLDRTTSLPLDGPLSEEHFMLLQRSPSRLLANMVLNENVLPEDLESVTTRLGCSLPHILSLELCSSLPSVPPARPDVYPSLTNYCCGIKVLNASDMFGPSRHPALAVQSLLLSVLNELSYQFCLLQKLHKLEENSFPISLVNSKRMQHVLVATWELCYLDLTFLEPGAETLSFYCNLANLMFIHSLIHSHVSKEENFSDVFSKSLLSQNFTQQLAAMNTLSYQVGSLGVLTLWEVRKLALGVDIMIPPGTSALQQYAFKTDSCDPLALFVIFTGTNVSPKLQVLYTENLEEQLQQSIHDYVQHYVKIDSERVLLPTLIQQYIQSTKQNIRAFLKDYLDSSMEDKLDQFPEVLPIYHISGDAKLQFIICYGDKKHYKVSEIKNFPKNIDAKLCDISIQYIKGHSPLVALLLQDLLTHSSLSEGESESDGEAQEAIELIETTFRITPPSLHKLPCLERLCKRPEIASRSQLFDTNILLCALHSMMPEKLLWDYLNNMAAENKWQAVVGLLSAIPKVQLLRNPMLTIMLDVAFLELVIECRDFGQSWLFCEKMNSVYFRARAVTTESMYWSGEVCLDQLQKILKITELKLYPYLFSKAEELMTSITIYQKIIDNCKMAPWTSWQEVQSESKKNPAAVLKEILSHGYADICILWLGLHHIVSFHPHLIDSKVLALLLDDGQEGLKAAEHLLQSLPLEKASEICFEALEVSETLQAIRFCVKFLNSFCIQELDLRKGEILKTISLGIQMVEVVPEAIQIECLGLIQNPHLMIEQLIMNVQLEAAEQMLSSVQQESVKLGSKSSFSIPALDSMFRHYAEKALEFNISQGSTDSQLSENSALLTSLSSNTGSKDFLMPTVVPVKTEWVPNEQASVCMNCQLSTFTMFNRRHHCRRCGRVVCAPCSPHKLLVQGYGTLKVRVCNSCHWKMNLQAESEVSSTGAPNSEASLPPENVWRLSNSSEYNETIRGDFSYDHAPSVSLCLSVLKLHSDNAACPNFLVDSCETILKYVLPQGGVPNPEVDYGFVIEMCRSLVLAAKVKCAQWGYTSDEPHCDQRLSKIDLFGILVSHGCTNLIPNETSIHGLRRLQTQLIEAELWDLALEVSTKAGMEKIGVWTAWGKGCLRVGRWEEAREKFTHCFPHSNRTNRSAPDSPLLLDILQILESTPHPMDQEVLCKADAIRSSNNRLAHSPAVAVLHSLMSLKNITQGKFTQTRGANGSLESLVYSECCYYLQEYGSHVTYLQFLVRHNDLKAAVQHTLAHSVDSQTFFESVYMPCLKRGLITPLHTAMTAVDSSLIVWKSYLHGICAALERRKLLHTLYEVQQWSKDHVRAAMTCVRFYHLNAKSYSQLAANINYLMRAQSHLEGALAEVSLSRKTDRSGSGHSSSSSSSAEGPESMWLQLTPKELDHHMSTVERQKELTRFLSAYEADNHTLFDAANFFPHAFAEPLAHGLPTLFGSPADRKFLAGLGLFCGKNVEEGYGVVYRIIEDFNLSASEIYEAVAPALYRSGRVTEITQLLKCIQSSGIANPASACDCLLMKCINEMPDHPNASHVDFLIRNISDQVLKIKAFIACGQLKSAYLLAVKLQRLDEVELILKEAEKLGQTAIQKICLKRLGQ